MKCQSKMARFLMSALMVTSLCACSNDLTQSETNNSEQSSRFRKLPCVSMDYGQLHNDLLDSCLTVLNAVNIEPYMIEGRDDENFYALYAHYSENIINVLSDYLVSIEEDPSTLPSTENLETPQDFFAYMNSQREALATQFPAGEDALERMEEIFDFYLSSISENVPLESDPYWQELSGNIEEFAEDIYIHSVDLCATEDECTGLEIMLSVMVGSFNYWSNTTKMSAWRELAWNANHQYLNLPDDEPHMYQGEAWQTVLREVLEFVTTDATGAEIGWWAGTICPGVGNVAGAVAIGSIMSGAIALTWE